MLDRLAIINKVIEEHQAIRRHIKLAGDSVPDREALTALDKARADFIPGRFEVLTEQQERLQQTLNFLDEGLKNHFAFEGKALSPLLGELPMKGLLLEHREIKNKIDEAKSIVASTKLAGLSREELLSREAHILQVVDDFCQLVEDHAAKEEAILDMVQRALEKKR